MRPTVQHLSITAVRADALFASALQRSDAPSGRQVQQAIATAVRQFGGRGCAAVVAQEYGEHPEAAARRMRWARQVVTETFAGPRLWRPREFQPTGHRVSPRGRAA
jgi:hypothetical protein